MSRSVAARSLSYLLLASTSRWNASMLQSFDHICLPKNFNRLIARRTSLSMKRSVNSFKKLIVACDNCSALSNSDCREHSGFSCPEPLSLLPAALSALESSSFLMFGKTDVGSTELFCGSISRPGKNSRAKFNDNC